jgi:hypothetical protein
MEVNAAAAWCQQMGSLSCGAQPYRFSGLTGSPFCGASLCLSRASAPPMVISFAAHLVLLARDVAESVARLVQALAQRLRRSRCGTIYDSCAPN